MTSMPERPDTTEKARLTTRPPGEVTRGKEGESGRALSESESPLQWNAGDLGCGELVLELRMRLERMPPGQILVLTARDPGAPADLPAWCRLTGHALVEARHPVYHIRRKET